MVCDVLAPGVRKTSESVVVICNAAALQDTTKQFITLFLSSSIFLISLDHLSEKYPDTRK
jgi:hypothetical protein